MIFFLILVIALVGIVIYGQYNERERAKENERKRREFIISAEKARQEGEAEAKQLEDDRAKYEEYMEWAKKGYGRPTYSSFEQWRSIHRPLKMPKFK